MEILTKNDGYDGFYSNIFDYSLLELNNNELNKKAVAYDCTEYYNQIYILYADSECAIYKFHNNKTVYIAEILEDLEDLEDEPDYYFTHNNHHYYIDNFVSI